MKKIIDFLWNVERVENLFLVIALFLAAGTAWVSALRFYFELRVALEDLRGRFLRHKDFKVKRTILKAIAKNDQTQIIKLRTLRVYRDLNSLDLDSAPALVDENDQGYLAISDHYSIPGVVRETHTYRLKVDFRDDEVPKARERLHVRHKQGAEKNNARSVGGAWNCRRKTCGLRKSDSGGFLCS